MLEHLRVQNIGLLNDASLEPAPGFTVITGETGAGKTLLLGGVRLLIGEKSDAALVGGARDTAQVDGQFDEEGVDAAVSRTVPKQGRSRSYLDGILVSADSLARAIGTRIEIVGQHDQIGLSRPSRILQMIDASLSSDGLSTKAAYVEAWESLQVVLERASQIGGDEMALRRELDLVRYQADEIESAGLALREDAEAENSARRLRNSEEIREHLGLSSSILDGLLDQVGEVVGHARKAAELDTEAAPLATSAENLAAEAGELSTSFRREFESLEADPSQLAAIESRLTAIGELKRKYGKTIEDILRFGADAGDRVQELEGLLDAAGLIESELLVARTRVQQAGAELTEARKLARTKMLQAAQGHLEDLSLDRAKLSVDFENHEAGPNGLDRLILMFSSDGRLESGPVASVASGGELSRLVLALRLAASDSQKTTLVFDEVDAGIGGATATAMGKKLAALAKEVQVLCVTHLPQVAAHADKHYLLDRSDSEASLTALDQKGRVREISRMLAGMPDSEASTAAASELLEMAAR